MNTTAKLAEAYRVLLEQSRAMLDAWPQAVVIILTGVVLWWLVARGDR